MRLSLLMRVASPCALLLAILLIALTTKVHSQTKYVNLGNGSSSAGLNDPALSNASCSEFDGYGGPVPNTPFSNWYAAALTIGNSSRGVQIVHGYPQYDELYFRGGTDGWHNWRKILTDANFSSFALPLTGGTITGNLDVVAGIRAGANNGGGAMLTLADDATFYDDQNTNIRLRMTYGGSLQIDNGGLTTTGNVGIGTTDTKGYTLAVNGNAIFTKIKVKQYGNWPDYVFDSSYRMRPLPEIEQYIQQHHHLPELPSAEEVEKSGLDLGENQATMLKKIEELTLYAIEQNKNQLKQQKLIEEQRGLLKQQQKEIEGLKEAIKTIKQTPK
jgi:hypothetical protein